MKNNLKVSKVNKGFSLIEVLLAVVLLAIVVTPLIGTIYTSMNLNQNSKKMMAATDLTQDILEHYESMVLDDVVADLNDFGGTGSSTVATNPKPFGYVRSGVDVIVPNVGLSGIRGVEQAALKSTNLHVANSEDINNLYKCSVVVGSSDVYFFGITDVNYEGYKFDVFICLEPNPSCNTTDEYYIYNMKVEVFEVNNNKNGHNASSGRIVSDNLEDYIPLTSYSGSVFNKID